MKERFFLTYRKIEFSGEFDTYDYRDDKKNKIKK